MSASLPILKAVPQGLANIEEIRGKDYAYVDKTPFIETLEAAKLKYVLVICPRQFGKSLFASTLTAYYDKAAASKFDRTFAGTYIGSHKTKLASRLYVLKFDFSEMLDGENPTDSLLQTVRAGIEDFFVRYPIRDFKVFLKRTCATTAPNDLLLSLFAFVRPTVRKNLFVILDEYDPFANDPVLFKIYTETVGSLRKFYAQLKRATNDDGVIARICITGTASTVLNSIASDFGIARDLSEDDRFSTLFGFTETELRTLIPDVIDPTVFGHSVDEIVDRMKKRLTACRLSPFSRKTVFNPTKCLYYLDFIQKNNQDPPLLTDDALVQNA